MRPLKWILIALAGLVALLLTGVLVVTQWVDPDVYKPRIVAALAAATGRPVALPGELALAWYPWLALRTGAGSLGNPPPFPGPPLLSWREARLGARLLPLLRGEFVLDRVRLDGVDLQLRRDTAGRVNWQGLTDAADGSRPGASRLEIAGLDLREARVSFVDETDGTRIVVDGLELTTGPWVAGQRKPLTLEARFALRLADALQLEQARLRTAVTPGEGEALTFALGPTTLSARVRSAGLAAAGVPVSLGLPAAILDLDRTACRVPAMQVSVGAARLALRDLSYEQPGESPLTVGASFALAPTSLRALLVTLGIEAPVTADPRALESFAVEGRLALAGDALDIEPLTLVLDDTRLAGRLQRAGEPPLAQFALAGDSMNLDRYLEPDDPDGKPFKFPAAALGALRARGTLTLETATFDSLAFEGLVVRLLLDEQGLRGDPAAAADGPAAGTTRPPRARGAAR